MAGIPICRSGGYTHVSSEDLLTCRGGGETRVSWEDLPTCRSGGDTHVSSEDLPTCRSGGDTRVSSEDLPTCRSSGDTRVSSEDLVQRWILLVDRMKHQDVTVFVVYVQDIRHQDLIQEPEIRDRKLHFTKKSSCKTARGVRPRRSKL